MKNNLAICGGSPVRSEPFPAWPVFDAAEEQALLAVLRSGRWWCLASQKDAEVQAGLEDRYASKVFQFQDAFAKRHQARYGTACANGTAALEIALKALGVGPGDEVIVPAYTFVATAASVLSINAVPIFVDIDERTLNIEPARIEQAITARTKAIVPVHFAGQPADMSAILAIARRHGLVVVEDAAQAHGASCRNRPVGGLGDAGTFSFQASKNMTAGEGGLITTNDSEVAAKCQSYVSAGRAPGRPWYEHHRLGWNYRMTEFQGAILLEQLRRLEEHNARRTKNARYLSRRLAEIPGIHPLHVPDSVTQHAYHLYVFRVREEEFGISRNQFLSALAKEGIPCTGGYKHPVYKNPMFLNQDFYPKQCPLSCGHYGLALDYASFENLCPESETACREAVWLEHRLLLGTQADMSDILCAVQKIYDYRAELASRIGNAENGF